MTTVLPGSAALTFAVWRAMLLREALDRLFAMRAAWFWLLVEPMLHIGFITFLMAVVRLRQISGADAVVWTVIGLLGFFLFRRTAIQSMYGVDCNRPLFVYRQVKPVDPPLVRAVLEAFLMLLVSTLILSLVALLGRNVLPDDPLRVLLALAGLWLLGLGYGLVVSVLIILVRELEHIFKILMLPLYLISGVIFPLAVVPPKYLDWLMLNPVAHGLEMVRGGFHAGYHTVAGASLAYLYAWALCFICIGFVLHRVFALRLVMR